MAVSTTRQRVCNTSALISSNVYTQINHYSVQLTVVLISVLLLTFEELQFPNSTTR